MLLGHRLRLTVTRQNITSARTRPATDQLETCNLKPPIFVEHMKSFIALALIVLVGCGGTLSEEQRKKLREGMERNIIKKVSDAQLTEAAFDVGRTLAAVIEKSAINDKK